MLALNHSMHSFGIAYSIVLLVALLLFGGFLFAGCGGSADDALPPPDGEEVYSDVRGEFQAPATGGRDMIVHHDTIPDFMDPMLMTLPIDRPGSLDTLDTGTPIVFDMQVSGGNIQARNIRVLPDTVTLDLPNPRPNGADEAP